MTSRLAVGGIAPLLLALCERLDPSEFSCTLVTGSPDRAEGNMLDLVTPPRFRLEVVPELSRAVRPTSDFMALAKVRSLFRSLRPQVVHTHAAKGGAVGRLAAVLAGVPLRVHSFHGHVFRGYFSPRASRAVELTERALARFTHAIVAPSEGLIRELVERYRVMPRWKGHVIPHGIDADRFATLPDRSLARRTLGVPERAFVIGMVGRIVPIKNHRMMLESLARLRAAGRDVHLLVVGGGESRPALESLVRERGIADRVTFAGFQKELAPVYSAMDALALTSHTEGLPTSILEGMAAGIPIVATAVGGVVEVVEDKRTGLLVPPGNVDAMSAAITETIDAPAAALERARRGRDHVLERFSLSATVRATAELYRELLRS